MLRLAMIRSMVHDSVSLPSSQREKVTQPKSMQAAILKQPGQIEICAVPTPTPGPGEVRVRVQGCGVCASNLSAWVGAPWFSYPMAAGALGHEAYGVVDLLGPDTSGVAVGQRVAMLSYAGYAQYDIAKASEVISLPDNLADIPVPGEPLGCAMNIFARSGIREGDWVAIIGVGFLGALLIQLAARKGARVIAAGRRLTTLALARQLGAEHALVLDGNTARFLEQVKAITKNALCDVVIEATGAQEALDLATELTGERKRLVIAGYHQDGPRQVNMQLWNWRGLDVINAHERASEVYVQGIKDAIREMEAGALNPVPLYTHVLPLAELGKAFELMQQRPDGFMKAIVTP